jgi:hypothetical protein
MFRTPYPVLIKILIFNQLKISTPSVLFFLFNFLVNPLHTSVYPIYKPLILDGFLKFSWFCKNGYKTPYFLSLWFLQIFGEERVFILYNFPYLYLGSFPLSVLFSSIKSNPQHYRVYYNVSNYFARKFIFKNFWIPIFI